MADKEKVKEVKEIESVEMVEPKPLVAKPKYVTVKSKFTGLRCIGGTWYNFEKDKEIKVTEDAKRVLLDAGMIYI